MGSSSPALSNMQFLVLLSAVAVAFASPIPEEGAEAPVALAYVHDATGDVAVAYVHEEPVVAPVAVAAPAIAYAAYPYTYGAYPYLAAGAVVPKVEVKAAEAPAAVAPVTYAAYPYHHAYPYAVAAYHTGCVNNVGSVVP